MYYIFIEDKNGTHVKHVFMSLGHMLTSTHAYIDNMGHGTEKMSMRNKDKMSGAPFDC